jgi:hypothetical protein
MEDVGTARAQFRRIYNDVVSRRKEREQNKEVLARLGVEMEKRLQTSQHKAITQGKQ